MSGTPARDLQYTAQTLVGNPKASRAATGCQREYSKVSQMALNSLSQRCLIFFLLGFFFFFVKVKFITQCSASDQIWDQFSHLH